MEAKKEAIMAKQRGDDSRRAGRRLTSAQAAAMTVSAMMLTGLLSASVATMAASSGQKSCVSAMAEREAVDSTYITSSITRWPSAESATAAHTLPARQTSCRGQQLRANRCTWHSCKAGEYLGSKPLQ